MLPRSLPEHKERKIDLTTFDDYDDFINFCKAIHADETNPELMAQDYGKLANYFDYAAFARELFMCDYYFDSGHVFRRY